MAKRFELVLLCGLVSGCASAPDPALVEAASKPVTCQGSEDCAAKWSRAVNWVVLNSQWKIQTQTEQMIETFNPTAYSAAAGFTITKVSNGNGAYEIDFLTRCVNMFGCAPSELSLQASFVSYVMRT